MKLHEYQAKALLADYGVPVPRGKAVATPGEAEEQATRLGGEIGTSVSTGAVVKAQIHAGGRGKAGGVRPGSSAREVAAIAESLLGRRLVTAQTGPGGVPVNQVLVEEAVEVAREFYLSITTSGGYCRPLIIASTAGGTEIEELAIQHPERIVQEVVDPAIGLQPFQARRLARRLDVPSELVREFGALVARCYKAYMERDCSLIEINPLAVTSDGRLLALDAKVAIDDDALFRQPDEAALADWTQEDPLEIQAAKAGVAYVKLDGDVGCIVNGAGLAMATMDIIKSAGGEPANFLDVGGGASQERVAHAVGIMISDPEVEQVLVNIFGGILRCDVAARGIVEAYARSEVKPPLVVRMLGTNVAAATQILEDSGLSITYVHTLQEAADALRDTPKGSMSDR